MTQRFLNLKLIKESDGPNNTIRFIFIMLGKILGHPALYIWEAISGACYFVLVYTAAYHLHSNGKIYCSCEWCDLEALRIKWGLKLVLWGHRTWDELRMTTRSPITENVLLVMYDWNKLSAFSMAPSHFFRLLSKMIWRWTIKCCAEI